MNPIILRKRVRAIAARLGVLRPLRAIVLKLRGSSSDIREVEFLRRFIDSDSLVFDVGANRGQSSENYIKMGARVVAFEPQQDLHPEIRQLCRNSPLLSISSCGLGSAEETKRFFLTSYDQTASFCEDWGGERIGEKIIQVSTLDHQIAIHGMPTYCKIDVEGWELEVLKGLSNPIPIISFEYHKSPEELEKARDVLECINKLGIYFCNIKQSKDADFLLSEFVSMNKFVELFPTELDPPVSGYGDIYCTRDKALFNKI